MHAGVEEFLRVVESAKSTDLARVLSIDTENVLPLLEKYVVAYDAGYISTQGLLQVLVLPYIQLLQCINLAEKTTKRGPDILSEQIARFLVVKAWKQALTESLIGYFQQPEGEGIQFVPPMRVEKHAEYVRAMLAANFPQV